MMSILARLTLAATLLLLAACQAAAPTGTAPAAPASAPRSPSAPAAPQDASSGSPAAAAGDPFAAPVWQELAEAARREGKLVLAGGPTPATRQNLPRAFKERFGVDVEYLGGRTNDLHTRLQNERGSGLYTIDVLISGGDSSAAMYSDGWFQPIRPMLVAPEVNDPSQWVGNRLPFLDAEEQYNPELMASVNGTVSVNTQSIRDGEITKLDDLIDPKWRGKISVEDPLVAGSGQNRGIYLYRYKGEDFFKRFYVDQQPMISRETRQMGDWLARGTYPITIGISANDIGPMEKDGLPVKLLGTLDGPGYVTGGYSVLCVLTNQPHPNATKLFVNWIMSAEGQRVHAEAESQSPLRKDVAAPWLRDYQTIKEGVDYMRLYDYRYVLEEKPAIRQRMREIMGG